METKTGSRMSVGGRRTLIVLGAIGAAVAVVVAVLVNAHGGHQRRPDHVGSEAATAQPPTISAPARSAPSPARNWPSARDTGADPAAVSHQLPTVEGWYRSSAPSLTISDAEIDGGVFWSGSGTLTLRNVVLKPNWATNWASVVSASRGSVTLDHVTIAGVHVGAPGSFMKGFTMEGGGSLDVGYLNESGVCQNDLGSGPAYIHDSYIHDIGSGNAATCHATGVELESHGSGPVTIRHNTIDEFPGKDFVPGTDGTVFEQGLYGPIPKVVIEDNYLHSAYWSIEISPGGRYPVTGPVVKNNCLAWPSGNGGAAVSDPNHTIKVWSGNIKCDDRGNNTGQPVPLP